MYQHKLNGFSNYRCYDRPFAGIHSAILSIRRDERFQEQARGRSYAAVSLCLHFRFSCSPCDFSPFVPSPASEKECERERERERERENNARVSNA